MSKEKLSSRLIAYGIISLVFSLFMNTTVETEFGSVHNLGLLSKQSNFLILGFFLISIGVILKITKKNQSPGKVDASTPVIQDMALPEQVFGGEQSIIDLKQNNKALRLVTALLLAIFLLLALFGIMLSLSNPYSVAGSIIFVAGFVLSILAPIAYVFKRDCKISDLMLLAKNIYKFSLFTAIIFMAIFCIVLLLGFSGFIDTIGLWFISALQYSIIFLLTFLCFWLLHKKLSKIA